MTKFESTKRQKLANFALAGATFFFVAFIAELALRLSGHGNLVIYRPDPKLFWFPQANQEAYTKVGRKPIQINNHGTRGKDFIVPKPPHIYRILSLGDSKTFGWGLAEEETYSGIVQTKLRSHVRGNREVEVINAGVNAWSYAQMYVYLKEFALKYEPDLVILADANLWTQFSEKSSPAFVEQFMQRVWLKNLLRRSALYHYVIEVKLNRYYGKYRKKFIPVDPDNDELFKEEQQADPKGFITEQITRICELLNENGVNGLLIYIPGEGELAVPINQPDLIREIKKSVSQQHGTPFLDFTPVFAAEKTKLYLEGDLVHLNAIGNQIIADGIVDFVRNRIEEKQLTITEN